MICIYKAMLGTEDKYIQVNRNAFVSTSNKTRMMLNR